MPGHKIYLKQKLGKAISTHMTIDYQTKDMNQLFGDLKKIRDAHGYFKRCFLTRCPSTDEWIKKLWYIHTMEYYPAMKKNTSESVLMMCMKLEPIIQSESQKVHNINIVY